MKKLIRNFIIRYIMRNMGHANADTRDAIFKAINDGIRQEFYEDSIYSLMQFTVFNLVKNGEEYHSYNNTDLVVRTLTACAMEGVHEALTPAENSV